MEKRLRFKGSNERGMGKPKREREQRRLGAPSLALRRFGLGITRSSDILALQRSVGNGTVANMIQRTKEINEDVVIRGNLDVAKDVYSRGIQADDILTWKYMRTEGISWAKDFKKD